VQPGDTLWSIAQRAGTSVDALVRLNGLSDGNWLQVGQVLQLSAAPTPAPTPAPAPAPAPTPAPAPAPAPIPVSTYTVQPGDTLWSIANRFGTTVNALVSVNGMSDANVLRSGQILSLPGSPEVAPAPSPAPSDGTVPRDLFGRKATDPAYVSLVPLFDRWADAYRIPRDLLKGLCYLESGWNNSAVSSVGAQGLGQLMPDTAAWINAVLLGGANLDPHVPEDNIRMSARYIRYLLDETGNENLAIGSYYQGIGAVRRYGFYADTVQYVQNVQSLRRYVV
jgi:LysM repeat protein